MDLGLKILDTESAEWWENCFIEGYNVWAEREDAKEVNNGS